jgi:hypothetical protein
VTALVSYRRHIYDFESSCGCTTFAGALKIKIVGGEIVGRRAPRAFDFGFQDARLDDADDALGDLVLEVEQIVERAFEPVRPEMRAGLGLDELGGDAELVSALANAPSST